MATDAAAMLATHLAGLYLTSVERREYDWVFGFADNAWLNVSSPWRILVDGRIAFAGSDDGQKFGLPAPKDGEEETHRLLGRKAIQQVLVRADTGDLSIAFVGHTFLEVINMSSGFEGWDLGAAGLRVIALGGGELAVFVGEPKS
jgi:hypothetical protein